MKNLKKDILSRVYLIYGFVCLFAIAILSQAFNIQFVNGAKWRKEAKELTIAYKNIDAIRGNIYASDGSLLATSIPKYEIRFDVKTAALTDKIFYSNIDSLSYCLSQAFPKKSKLQFKEELINARKKGERYHLIKRNVKYTTLKKVKKFPIFRKGRYKGGFIYTQQNKRVKPFKQLAERTIGYSREGVQPVGLEGAYSSELMGVNGKRLMQKIAGGVWMPLSDKNTIEPVDGGDVYSTIDINIQDVAENALRKELIKNKADHGCVVLMEVATGNIRAIANLQMMKDSSYAESYNYAIGESTEPGSTFKLASLIAAFEDGYLSLDDMVDTENGTHKFFDRTMRDSHRGGYGKITIKQAFVKSSNVAISKAITRVYGDKPQQYIDRLYQMDLNKKLGLAIAGEGSPFIKSVTDKSWSGVSLPWMSIGYEVRLTPLQILTLYNAVANNGKMVKPKFVEEIKEHGHVVKKFPTVVINNSICSQSTIKMAKEMLEGVVEEGTGRNLKNSLFKIAGKTGTAQIANKKYGYRYKSKVSHQASFVGYFPADNPKYSCIVVVNAPSQKVYYGNLVAGPIFKEVADKVYASSLAIHHEIEDTKALAKSKIPYSKDGDYKDLNEIYTSLNIKTQKKSTIGEWAKTATGTNNVAIYNKRIPPIYVPNVMGMGIKDALFILENEGFNVKFNGDGTVKKQSIMPGDKIIKGATIVLELT